MVRRTVDPGDAHLVVLEKGPNWWDRMQQNGAWTNRFRLGKQTYDHGLFTHAPSRLRVTLPEPATEFVADLGIASHGTVIFAVAAGGQELFRSGRVVGRDARVPVRVALGGASQFTLLVEDAATRSLATTRFGPVHGWCLKVEKSCGLATCRWWVNISLPGSQPVCRLNFNSTAGRFQSLPTSGR